MNVTAVVPGYLYAATDIFPKDILDVIHSIDWLQRPYLRLAIGRGLRRQLYLDNATDDAITNYCFTHIKPTIEHECSIKFDTDQQHSFDFWLDEPGFKPSIHQDGSLPSALQIYLNTQDRTDLGTVFYHTKNPADVLYTFDSQPNTGYIMLNQPAADRPELWHDMSQSVPDSVYRLCLYVTFGPYTRV